MGFGGHGHTHSHGHSHEKNGKLSCSKTVRLSLMIALTSSFFIVEIVVGHITNSITLIADSFHMLSDVIAMLIGLFAVRISKRKSSKNTFGWVRAEVLGALVNSVFLLSLCVNMLIETIERLIHTKELDDVNLLLFAACLGLFINLIGLFIFGHGHSHDVPPQAVKELKELVENEAELEEITVDTSMHDDGLVRERRNSDKESDTSKDNESRKCFKFSKSSNLNIHGVFLHVLADALGSVVVIISALLNKYHKVFGINKDLVKYIDPIMCLGLVIVILASTIPLLKESAFILLQTVPKDIKLNQLKEELNKVKGILNVHELHIWKLSGNKIIASAHITCHSLEEYMVIAAKVKKLFHEKGIHSTTIQPEFIDSINLEPQEQKSCLLECNINCKENTCCGDNGLIRNRTSKEENQI